MIEHSSCYGYVHKALTATYLSVRVISVSYVVTTVHGRWKLAVMGLHRDAMAMMTTLMRLLRVHSKVEHELL